MGILALSDDLINKILKIDFLKILWLADLDLLKSISIHIFVNENRKITIGHCFQVQNNWMKPIFGKSCQEILSKKEEWKNMNARESNGAYLITQRVLLYSYFFSCSHLYMYL